MHPIFWKQTSGDISDYGLQRGTNMKRHAVFKICLVKIKHFTQQISGRILADSTWAAAIRIQWAQLISFNNICCLMRTRRGWSPSSSPTCSLDWQPTLALDLYCEFLIVQYKHNSCRYWAAAVTSQEQRIDQNIHDSRKCKKKLKTHSIFEYLREYLPFTHEPPIDALLRYTAPIWK